MDTLSKPLTKKELKRFGEIRVSLYSHASTYTYHLRVYSGKVYRGTGPTTLAARAELTKILKDTLWDLCYD